MIKRVILLLALLIPQLSFATFPVIAGQATTVESSNTTTHPVLYPTGILEDNLLIACAGMDGAAVAMTWPGGWTDLETRAAGQSSLACRWQVAAGTETGTFNITSVASEQICAYVWRINGYELPATQAPDATSNSGGSINPDPTSHTPAGGAKDYLWLSFLAIDLTPSVSVYSTSYTNTERISAFTNICLQQRRELNATSDDPSALTLSGSSSYKAALIAIHPGLEGEATSSNSLLLLGPD